MKLKYQLLLLGLLSLIFPLTGWYALKSVDAEFREGLEQATKNNLTSLQASVNQVINNDAQLKLTGIVLDTLDEINIDGYGNEWQSSTPYLYKNEDNQLQFKIALVADKLALLIESNDKTIKINPNNTEQNDYVLLGIMDEKGMHQYKFYRQAEGIIIPQNSANNGPAITANWHENSNGYVLELTINSTQISRIGIASINRWGDKSHQTGTAVTGTIKDNNQSSLNLLLISSHHSKMQNFISNITPTNNHFIIKDKSNRIIYQDNKLPDGQNVSSRQWLITPIYQWLFGREDESNKLWFYREADGMTGVIAQSINKTIKYQLKSMLPHGQQNMVQTLLKAALIMMAVVLVLVLSYLMYSLWLAWRIRRLNNALHKVLDESGKLCIKMPSHKAKDEVGQLSRGIEKMLIELQEYTQYLKDLGSRLSHEMKTPLAIVQSSLDNLSISIEKEDAVFLSRAQDGLHRLKFILNQLSQLSQLKHSLETTKKQNLNLSQLCNELAQAYQSYIPQLRYEIAQQDLYINGSNELLAQLIDKIIENAVDFTPTNGEITFKLKQKKKSAFISIINTGSDLPKNINIFESMHSSRQQKQKDSVHLGLGLYLAQLITRFHGGKIQAHSRLEQKSVEFSIEIALI